MRGKRRRGLQLSLPEKVNKMLNVILCIFILILLRLWHLSIMQHDQKVEEAKKTQRTTIYKSAERAAISDRFGNLMATNQVEYKASILYSPIRQVPHSIWKAGSDGKKKKKFLRKEYITALSQLLGQELNLEPEKIEDIIHAKAATLGNVPFVLKENISEASYFRLKALERQWPGIYVEHRAKRVYPYERTGSEVIGYIGAISREEYVAITEEMKGLRRYLSHFDEQKNSALTPEAAAERLKELEDMAYAVNDFVGKSGVEANFDEQLRGKRGKKIYLSDRRGNFIKELPGGEEPKGGAKLTLTVSAELQEYAEKLLIEHDQQVALSRSKEKLPDKVPWMKGSDRRYGPNERRDCRPRLLSSLWTQRFY